MKTDILSSFENMPYFTIEGFRQVAGVDSSDQIVRNLLHRWVRAGHLVQLKNGVYMTRRTQMVYKHAISTVVPSRAVNIPYEAPANPDA